MNAVKITMGGIRSANEHPVVIQGVTNVPPNNRRSGSGHDVGRM
jgi:hypothetical protein